MYPRLSKSQINELPIQLYTGEIKVITTSDVSDRVAQDLMGEKVLGFDIEIRPSFRKGQSFPPSLLQLACAEVVYIFILKYTGLPGFVIDIFEHNGINKVGVSVDFDKRKLQEIRSFKGQNFLDLAVPAKKGGMNNFGLRGLAALLLGFRIPKGAQKTNWAQKNLTERQLRYAATDAWVGREIYMALWRKKMLH